MAFILCGKDGKPRLSSEKQPVAASFLQNWAVEKASFTTDESTGERRFRAIASTASQDREADVINQRGFFWQSDKNTGRPLVAGPWCHDYHGVPVMRVEGLGVTGDALQFVACFPAVGRSALADEVFAGYEDGRLFGFSVGFRPVKYSKLTPSKMRELGLLTADAPLTDDSWVPGYYYEQQELLEISAVPVPANPEAVARMAGELASKSFSAYKDLMVPDGLLSEGDESLEFHVDYLNADPASKNVVPYKGTAISETKSWSVANVKTQLEEWAGLASDKISSWKKFARGFLIWPGIQDSYVKSDFNGLHHNVEDGVLMTSKSGVISCAASLIGAREKFANLSEQDIAAAKAHLGRHYKQFSLTPPWESDNGKRLEELLSMEKLSKVEAAEKEFLLLVVFGDSDDEECEMDSSGGMGDGTGDGTGDGAAEGDNPPAITPDILQQILDRLTALENGGMVPVEEGCRKREVDTEALVQGIAKAFATDESLKATLPDADSVAKMVADGFSVVRQQLLAEISDVRDNTQAQAKEAVDAAFGRLKK